jgi:DNA-binding CsgD family transcriptional regulator
MKAGGWTKCLLLFKARKKWTAIGPQRGQIMSRAAKKVRADAKGAPAAPTVCDVGSAMFCDPAWKEIRRSLRFSGRELEIVRGMFDDQKESAIAASLGIAPGTVHTHIERLYHKLGITDRAQLLVRVMREFLTLTARSDLPPICASRAAGRCPLQR